MAFGGILAKSAKGMVRVAYPAEEPSAERILEIASSVENAVLKDIFFPKSVVKSFKGPAFGTEGLRKKSGNGPLRCARMPNEASIGKFLSSASEKGFTNICEIAPSSGGRVREILEFEDENDIRIQCAFNVNAENPVKYAEGIVSAGAGEICADSEICGLSAVHSMRKLKVPIRVNIAESERMSIVPTVKIARMFGADSVRIKNADDYVLGLCADDISVPYRPVLPIIPEDGRKRTDAMVETDL